MSIKENLDKIKRSIPDNVTLVAVSKTKPLEDIIEAYNAGHRVFGENKVQELTVKHEALPKDIEWHMIGRLQSNKVKYIAPFVSLIHGVDSMKLAKEINKRAIQNSRVINCLLQVKIALEDTKAGFEAQEADDLISGDELNDLKGIRIVGLMGMASNDPDENSVRMEFRELKSMFDKSGLDILSTGMSGDFQIAIEEGSTMVRIGSLIFGARNYTV